MRTQRRVETPALSHANFVTIRVSAANRMVSLLETIDIAQEKPNLLRLAELSDKPLTPRPLSQGRGENLFMHESPLPWERACPERSEGVARSAGPAPAEDAVTSAANPGSGPQAVRGSSVTVFGLGRIEVFPNGLGLGRPHHLA
jgi:hypothetical protein